MNKQIIECVPNFSEGRDSEVIRQISEVISQIEGVKLLDVDPGKTTNRTVVTFVGEPENVIEAAYQAIVLASKLIDMSKHSGEHARMGATDVCPLIPVSHISLEETAEYAIKLAKRVGEHTDIPVYLYGAAQTKEYRKDLSIIRSGEYEGFFNKIEDELWKPDFGPSKMNPSAGATVIGARDFLIAYNINLNTKSTRIANRIAFDVREAGRVSRVGNPFTGPIELDKNGEPVRIPGTCKAVKAVGWYIEEYGIAQISANLVDHNITPIHKFFDEVDKSARERGVRITGSELVGLLPLQALLDAGKHFLQKQDRSTGVSDSELIHIAVKSLGLDELAPFVPEKKIIEYAMRDATDERLIQMTLKDFTDETASESMAPGGGSISALAGSLGASLSAMVANLSANKKGWEHRVTEFSDWAEKAQEIKAELLFLVDEDTRSFNGIIDAMRLENTTEIEKQIRREQIESASVYAAEVPLMVMKAASKSFEIIKYLAHHGNQNSITDVGVGSLCTMAAIEGAGMNVKVNAKGLTDKMVASDLFKEANQIIENAQIQHTEVMQIIEKVLDKT